MKQLFGRFAEVGLYGVGPLAIFITAPILARGLGPEARGELGVAQSVASFALAIGIFGQADVLLAHRRLGVDSAAATRRVSAIASSIATLLSVGALLVLGISAPIAIAAGILLPIMVRALIWRSEAIAAGKTRLPAYMNGTAAILRVALLVLLFYVIGIDTWSAMLVIQLSVAGAGLITVGAWKARIDIPTFTGVPTSISSSWLAGLPLVAFAFLTSVTLRADMIALSLISDQKTVGVYAAASGLTMAVLAVSGAFKTRVQHATFSSSALQQVIFEMKLVLVVGLSGAIGAIILAPALVDVLFGDEYADAVTLLRVLAVSSVGLLILDSVHGLLAALGERSSMVQVGAVGAFSTLVTLVLLVPHYGALGAAISTVVSYTSAAVYGWIVARRVLLVQH